MAIDPTIALQGQTPKFETPLDAFGRVLAVKNALLNQQLGQQRIQAGALEQQQAQQSLADQQQLRQALQQSSGDPATAMNKLAASGNPLALKLRDQMLTQQKAQLDVQQIQQKISADKTSHVASLTQAVLNQPPEARPAAYQAARQVALANGYARPQDLPEQYGPQTEALITQLSQQAVSAKDQIDQRMKAQQDALNATKAQETQRHNLTTEEQAALNSQQVAKHNAAMEQHANQQLAEQSKYHNQLVTGAGTELTPEGLDAAAQLYSQTGQLPAMGFGKAGAGVRARIINRAADLNPGLNLAANKANFQADEGSLRSLQKNRDAIKSFEDTASKNLDQFISTAKNVIDSGSPLVNTPLRLISDKMVGSDKIAAYNAARQVALNEIAKVVSNPGMSGQLSDNARKEVEALNPQSATLKQVYAVANILKSDMKNRQDALDRQIGEIKERLHGKSGASIASPGGASGSADYTFHPDTGLQKAQ